MANAFFCGRPSFAHGLDLPGSAQNTSMHATGLLTPRNRNHRSRLRGEPCGLPHHPTRSAFLTMISELNTAPALPPVNAWPEPSPALTHDSVPRRLATPYRVEELPLQCSARFVLALLRVLVFDPIWGSGEITERLWKGWRSPEWKIEGVGLSTLGEIVGWARTDEFPPRNMRTSKGLRALGNPVKIGWRPMRPRRRMNRCGRSLACACSACR